VFSSVDEGGSLDQLNRFRLHRHFILVEMNAILDVPIKQRYNFRFDFSGWNVTVILHIRMSEMEG